MGILGQSVSRLCVTMALCVSCSFSVPSAGLFWVSSDLFHAVEQWAEVSHPFAHAVSTTYPYLSHKDKEYEDSSGCSAARR